MDNAFEKARAAYGTGAYDDATLEFIFPQLKESEDERIRTRLSEYFRGFLEGNEHCYEDGGYVKWEGLDVKSILDWLKKQKEQKPWKVGVNAYFTPEQKPAEVDESTKRLNDNWMKQHFDDYEEQKSAQSREEILHQLFQNGSISLSDYLYLTGEQKPAEMPSFDEAQGTPIIKQNLKNLPEGYYYIDREGQPYYLTQESLRPVNQEWSEEDEKMSDTIVSVLGQYIDYKAGSGTGSGYATPRYSKEIAWLNSLRPSWRPSEEDIKMLEHIIGQYETGNKNSKVMGYLPRVEELSFLKNVLSKWKN